MMREIPPSIRKPSRYGGGEGRPPAIAWDDARVRGLLAFPDVYEIGMSHLGILLLREILSARPGTLCERVFAPWTDYEEHLRAAGEPLASLESGRPAGTFDLLGFSLCYELTYTNVLAMIDLSGIPLLSKDRAEGHPLVVAGGVCTLNPAPVAPFFDALLVGDGEEAVLEIVALVEERKERGGSRADLLSRLSGIEGGVVPGGVAARPGGPQPVSPASVADPPRDARGPRPPERRDLAGVHQGMPVLPGGVRLPAGAGARPDRAAALSPGGGAQDGIRRGGAPVPVRRGPQLHRPPRLRSDGGPRPFERIALPAPA